MQGASADAGSLGAALRDYGLAELASAEEQLALPGSRVHDGIQQARKAIRRTRAMLGLVRTMLGPGGRLVDRELRRMNQRLSPLRDAHALVQTLDRLRTKARNDRTRSVLAHAQRVAVRRRTALARCAAFRQTLRDECSVLGVLRAALQALPWATVSALVVSDAMVRASQTTAFSGWPRHAAPTPTETGSPRRVMAMPHRRRFTSHSRRGVPPST